jgi:hypothetical protein
VHSIGEEVGQVVDVRRVFDRQVDEGVAVGPDDDDPR